MLLLYILSNSKNEKYEINVSDVYKGAVGTAKDLSSYARKKWEQLKYDLKNDYKETLIRKMLKFLNNSNFTYLGKIQDPKAPNLIKRKTVTPGASLLQQFCLVANNHTKQHSKTWLLRVLEDNFDDYVIEQLKLKSSLYSAILSLGNNFGILINNKVLQEYMKEIIDEDYEYILDQLKVFENKQGVNICTGKKSSFFGNLGKIKLF